MLMGLLWFQRAWTVQDHALAKKCCMYRKLSHMDVAEVFEIPLGAERYTNLSLMLDGYASNGVVTS